jgi:hypothetical protein
VSTDITNSSFYEYSVTDTVVTASTEEAKTGSFQLVINVGCYHETQIFVDPTLDFYNQDYAVVIVLKKADLDEFGTWFEEFDIYADLFRTEVSNCIAHSVSLCADSLCSSLLQMESIVFEENPAYNSELPGEVTTKMIVDRRNTSLYEEVFIVGATRDPTINASLNALIVVCGE